MRVLFRLFCSTFGIFICFKGMSSALSIFCILEMIHVQTRVELDFGNKMTKNFIVVRLCIKIRKCKSLEREDALLV